MESKMDVEERSLSLIHGSDHDDAPREQAMQEDPLTPWSLDYASNNFDTDGEEELFENYIMGGSGTTMLLQSGMDLSQLDYVVISGGGLNTMPDGNATTSSSNTCWSMDDDLEILHDEPMPDKPKSFLFQHHSAMTCNHNWMNTPMTSTEWDRIREEESAEVARARHHQRTGGEEKTEGELLNETPRALSHWTSTAWDYDESH
jgi:hypothetical protein